MGAKHLTRQTFLRRLLGVGAGVAGSGLAGVLTVKAGKGSPVVEPRLQRDPRSVARPAGPR